MRIFELLGEAGTLDPRRAEMVRSYAAALEAYRLQHWDQARELAVAALTLEPDDGPSHALLARIDATVDAPPGPDWDGVTEMRSK